MKILVTGAAGFIGYFTAKQLLDRGDTVVGLDNFNDFYDPAIKRRHASRLATHDGFRMVEGDIRDADTAAAVHTLRDRRGHPLGGDQERWQRRRELLCSLPKWKRGWGHRPPRRLGPMRRAR